MNPTYDGIQSLPPCPYSRPVEVIREDEYPHMKQGIYLDHSGTTIYARTLIDRFAHKMSTNLYGNPHSANQPAKISGDMVDAVRAKALRFLGADPRHFDLVFVSNATAAIKLVADSFRDLAEQTRSGRFWMGRVFNDPEAAPDFACVSFYKIFGFPDLGGLVVRRDSGHILALRRYFGGGTVSMVSAIGGAWHVSKGLEAANAGQAGEADGHAHGLHEGLEDGTLPFHSILALGEAIDVHRELYGSMENISLHTTRLVRRLYEGISSLRYANGQPLCKVYCENVEEFGDAARQGATVAFNVFCEDGSYVPYSTVEHAANERGIYVRSGGICCPGGIFSSLGYEPWQLKRARSAGHHCGSDGLSIINELPTGVVRASLGAMSTTQDVDAFVSFLHGAFIEGRLHQRVPPEMETEMEHVTPQPAYSTG
ncbi:pyridoxal phosphate-dependent transferase [Cercophora newfieldiana]|uniref:Pyridoxal phosphate-dependent transferase n=1 Tax=Cercophora newfieldiana TaxID=92897 RepID=A0AA39YNE5_9PEZI|nr:pyridoxal phosphate-dependent transferase [Cercophora newfieldiana]